MACTPDSAVHLQRSKKLPYGGSFSDSGFSDVLSCSGKTDAAKHGPCRFLSSESEDYRDTPKENLSVTPKKERPTETPRLPEKDLRRAQQQSPAVVGWCETPKVSRKKEGPSLRRRLLMCNVKPVADGKTDPPGTPCTKAPEPSLRFETKARFSSGSSDSPDSLFGSLSSSTLRPELGCRSPLSTRKRRLFFAQVKTSTHEYVRGGDAQRIASLSSEVYLNDSIVSSGHGLETPRLDRFLPALERDACKTPVNVVSAASPCHGLCVLNTPSALTPTHVRSLSEDSGFGSVAHDKSHDSLGDHNGSFQELLPPPTLWGPRAGGEALLHLSDGKRRSRFQRQQRLSTLREGGSQSEEDSRSAAHAASGANRLSQCDSPCKADDVFLVAATTPSNSTGLKIGNRMTPLGRIAAKQDTATPLHMAKKETPTRVGAAGRNNNANAATPLHTTPVGLESLSLTPALQLVQAMCLRKASLMLGQSPSFELELRSVVSLVETPVAVRTCMPLAGLIGKKMGQSGVVHVTDAETRLALTKRAVLGTIQAQSRSLSYGTPQSAKGTVTPSQLNTSHSGGGSSSSKREKFLQVAKTLFSDECLKSCPRCQHPAKCHPVKKEGLCSRGDCGFAFCTDCMCDFHGARDCLSRSAGRHGRRDVVVPGSAQSKRNLRRL
ncbi:hypothetical protein CRUP_008174 [Coryphaenoides rupestris]|nr:hypothetical protein CRUP_008174 [Coryphaenoides rupestris]